jgi:cytochrome c553
MRMSPRFNYRFRWAALMVLGSVSAALALRGASVNSASLSRDDQQFFESRIRPVLVDQCYKCHSHDSDKVKGGLMLDTREGLLHGGSSGPALVPGKPDDSLLVKAILYTDEDLQMPPKGKKLSEQQIADLTEWVRRGAPDPRSLTAKGSAASYGGVGRDHWSFLPVKKQTIPEVKNSEWCRTPVDNFILAKLEASDMTPNAPADKRTLIRRATFDLIGLPPTETEVEAFLADSTPDAFAKVVDRLLASPHYGERWGRYWLDVARYGDTKGEPEKRTDPRYPDAWTYRDYVIDAFNRDKPYDQFILDQLAADRIYVDAAKKAKTPSKNIDTAPLAALGFLTLGNRFDGNQHDIINDRIDVTTKAFLGLTVSCARCHDHKFDPIPQRDYYSLYGIFANTVEPKLAQLPFVRPVPRTAELDDYLAKMQGLEKQKEVFEKEFAEFRRSRNRDPEKRKELLKTGVRIDREIADLECTHAAAPPRSNVLVDVANPKDYPVLLRGEAQNPGDIVPRRFLEILSPKQRPTYRSGSGRLELAQAIASRTNPLTARVLVNRVWQQHFGDGFVATPDDLGNMSSPPTHPELLDYLASRFVDDGWSIKKLHRLILLSSVYQVSGAANPHYADLDPDNALHWRYNLRRLDFEEMHDALLAIAGQLDPAVGGKSIPIGSEQFATRRAIYTYIDRRNPAELLTQFDFPNPSVPSGKRYLTLVPQQSLFLMNSPLVIETSRKLVHRPEFLQLNSDEERVTSLYLALYQRPPTPQEIKVCIHYVETDPAGSTTEAPTNSAFAEKNTREAQMEARRIAAAQTYRKKNAPQSEPGGAAFKSRAPLDTWTKLAHALFQTNEAMFFD